MNEEEKNLDYDLEDVPDSAVEDIEEELADEETAEEDAQEGAGDESEAEENGGDNEAGKEGEEEPQTYEIEINGSKEALTLEQLIERAKGGAPDAEKEEMISQLAIIDAFAKDAGMSRGDYLKSVSDSYKQQRIEKRTKEISDADGYDEDTARRIAELEIERDDLKARGEEGRREQEEKTRAEERGRAAFEADMAKTEKLYGKLSDADMEAITPLVAEGMTILEAYQRVRLEGRESAKKQAEATKARGMGSAKGKGKVDAEEDLVKALMEA